MAWHIPFQGSEGFRERGCTRVKWVPFVLLTLFRQFYSIFRFKIGHFPLNVVFWELEKGFFRARKGQMVNSGFQDPKTTWSAFQARENVTTPQLASLHGLPPNWAKKCYKTGGGKSAKRTNGTYFARPQRGGLTWQTPQKVYVFAAFSLFLKTPGQSRSNLRKSDNHGNRALFRTANLGT